MLTVCASLPFLFRRNFDFSGGLNPVAATKWKPIEIFKSLFLLHHVCQAYRTVNERMRIKEHKIVKEKVDFQSSNYDLKLENDIQYTGRFL
jgi:hypothetical protein